MIWNCSKVIKTDSWMQEEWCNNGWVQRRSRQWCWKAGSLRVALPPSLSLRSLALDLRLSVSTRHTAAGRARASCTSLECVGREGLGEVTYTDGQWARCMGRDPLTNGTHLETPPGLTGASVCVRVWSETGIFSSCIARGVCSHVHLNYYWGRKVGH